MDWQDRARRQAGVISRDQLRRHHISSDSIDGLVRRNALCAVLPGVYSPRPVPGSMNQREWAAVLWSGGVLSHRSAARHWQLPVAATTIPHVIAGDRRFRGRVAGVRVHRVELDTAQVTTASGLRVTTRSRTVVDLLRAEPFGTARELRDRALQLGWVDERVIRTSISAQLGRTGNAQLRRLLAELEVGAQAESERLLHAILRRARLTGWVAQHRVRLGARTAYLDVGFPAQRLAIEVDGRRFHDDASDRFDDDRDRQNALIAAGWRVLRFTWRHLTQSPDLVLSRIVQLLAA